MPEILTLHSYPHEKKLSVQYIIDNTLVKSFVFDLDSGGREKRHFCLSGRDVDDPTASYFFHYENYNLSDCLIYIKKTDYARAGDEIIIGGCFQCLQLSNETSDTIIEFNKYDTKGIVVMHANYINAGAQSFGDTNSISRVFETKNIEFNLHGLEWNYIASQDNITVRQTLWGNTHLLFHVIISLYDVDEENEVINEKFNIMTFSKS